MKTNRFSGGLSPYVILLGLVTIIFGIIKTSTGFLSFITWKGSEIIGLGLSLIMIGVMGRFVAVIILGFMAVMYLIPALKVELTETDKQVFYPMVIFAVILWIFGTKIGGKNAGGNQSGSTSYGKNKKPSPDCYGEGGYQNVRPGIAGPDDTVWMPCYRCNGAGYIDG